MHGKVPRMILAGAAFLAVLIAAGCTGGTGAEKTPAGTGAPVVIKNTGALEIHAWIASDQAAWGGNHANRIGSGEQVTLTYIPANRDRGSTNPAYVCIGMNEKILKCTSLAPAAAGFTWDGTTLAPGP